MLRKPQHKAMYLQQEVSTPGERDTLWGGGAESVPPSPKSYAARREFNFLCSHRLVCSQSLRKVISSGAHGRGGAVPRWPGLWEW